MAQKTKQTKQSTTPRKETAAERRERLRWEREQDEADAYHDRIYGGQGVFDDEDF